MTSARSQGAMEDVLAIPELLEAVLTNLDMVTLLVSASRVSKTWKTVMDESPAVQQALFFKTAPVEASSSQTHNSQGDEEDQIRTDTGTRPTINPLLANKFGPCFFDFGATESFHRRANSFFELPWSSTPIQVTRETWGGYSQLRPAELDAEASAAEEESRRRFTRRGASWRRMHVSQPPPPSLGYMKYDISEIPSDGQKIWSTWLQPESGGLRMGELYDLVQHQAGSHGRHSLWFRVVWGTPKGQFAITHAKETFESLMAETSVVAEFMQADDTSLPNHPQDPADEETFDRTFKCEEYREAELRTEEKVQYPSEFPLFDGRYVVWHWRLFDHTRVISV